MCELKQSWSYLFFKRQQIIITGHMQIPKTGIIYDPRMLDHKARRKHPQTPHRIKVIMNILEQKKVLTHFKIDYIPSTHRLALEHELTLAHPAKYLNFCRNLWPKSGHRADITVLDTYFNEKSEDAARIAAGCLLEGIDKLMEGKWQNGFAVIRPPGHHSGAKNTINGFCIYNNVAIGANYILQKWKKQRVAIIDWDVHHGDGTQHVMQQNSQVLFVSLHRHDRGTFYPAGDQGSFMNNGDSAAKGTKINIPFDFVDETFQPYNFQPPGDNEYIYVYHRLIEPILKRFDPEVILISSGFDAANGDPLGGFTITPNGYYYLTKKILELKKPTLVALEGGYNLDSIKNSAYAIIKALLHEQPPQEFSTYTNQPLKQTYLKELCSIHPIMHEQIDQMVQFHSQFWPCLKEEELERYTQTIKSNQEKCFSIIEDQSASDESSSSEDETRDVAEFHNDSRVQMVDHGKSKEMVEKAVKVKEDEKKRKEKEEEEKQNKRKNSGKNHQEKKDKKKNKIKEDKKTDDQQEKTEQLTAQFYFAAGHMQRFKNFSLSNEKLHKWAYEPQIVFFQSSFEEKRFAPKYYGKEDNYIIIENLLYNKKPPITIMDIKVSRQSKNPFISQEKRLKQKKKEEKSTADKLAFRISGYTTENFKEGGIMTYTEDQVRKLLKLVVCEQNKQQFASYLEQMVECLEKVKRKYWGTSMVLVKSETGSVIRWIDFHYYVAEAQEQDKDLIEGLRNLKEFIQSIGSQ